MREATVVRVVGVADSPGVLTLVAASADADAEVPAIVLFPGDITQWV